jgi:hypothetical protein
MKKMVCILALICIGAGTVFAQAKSAETKPTETKPVEAKPAGGEKAAAPEETTAAARSGPRKNGVALDAFQLFKGFIVSDSNYDFSAFMFSFSYERLLVPHFSLGGDFDWYYLGFDGTSGFYFSMAAEGRYYPMSENFEKFFLGTTLGFNVLSLDGSTKPENGGFTGLIISLKTGYKLITAANIYLEPSLSYVLSKSSIASEFFLVFLGTPLGWNGGLRIGFAF